MFNLQDLSVMSLFKTRIRHAIHYHTLLTASPKNLVSKLYVLCSAFCDLT